jgi:hypothetical protein
VSLIACDREQGLGDGFEQQIVNEARVLIRDGAKRLGQCEHDMEVIDGQEISLSGLEPAFGGTGLTLRAMAVAAGVIGDRVRVALLTAQPMATELGGSAAFDRRHRLELPEA